MSGLIKLIRDRGGVHLPAVIDQSAYTAANFAVGIAIAATSGVSALGQYAIVSSIAVPSLSVLVTLTLDPLTIFGAHSATRRFRMACAKMAATGASALAAMAILAWIVALWFGLAGAAVVSLALLLCAAQYAVLARKRLYYVSGRIGRSLAMSVTYFACVTVVTCIAAALGRATVFTGVGAIVAGSLLAAGPWVWRSMRIAVRAREVYLRQAGVLPYVGGALVTSLSGSTALQSIYWVGALTAGVAVIGQIKLIEQIVLPYSQLLVMLSLPDQVQSARDYAQLNDRRVADRMQRRTRHFALGAGLYCLVTVAATATWEHVRGTNAALVLPVLLYGACLVLQAASYPRLIALRAYRRPLVSAGAYSIMGLCVLIGGLLFRPATATELVGLLVCAWALNLLTLQVGIKKYANPSSGPA